MTKLIPISTIRKLSSLMFKMQQLKEGTPEIAALAKDYFELEDECIDKYIKPDEVELTEENYFQFREELRERVQNALHGNKFRTNVGGTTESKQ